MLTTTIESKMKAGQDINTETIKPMPDGAEKRRIVKAINLILECLTMNNIDACDGMHALINVAAMQFKNEDMRNRFRKHIINFIDKEASEQSND